MISSSVRVLPTLLVLGAMSAGPVTVSADAEAGKAKAAQVCAACHGPDGNSPNPEWPTLAGQHAKYLVKQLADFKKGEGRSNPIMAGMVAGLSAEDMADLGEHFSAQPAKSAAADPAQVQLGQQIYRGGNAETGVPACMACHGPSGQGDPRAGFPRLAGQHTVYTETQLRQFRKGDRRNDGGGMMRDSARWLSDAEIAAVASYIAGLH
jgi:cytochrome c553